jgi:glycosyltransferase involved in cell wall biosynthesis
MKIAILSNRENSAISHVLRPVAEALGVDLFYYPYSDLDQLAQYDLVHIGYVGLLDKEEVDKLKLCSINVWNVSVNKIKDWAASIGEWAHYVVDDTTTLQLLGQLGADGMSLIPLAFDPTPFQQLSTPKGEFTVGMFCNAYPSKRYDVAYHACKELGVKLYLQLLPPSRTLYNLDPVRDVYSHIHTIVHCSYTDTNSMPVYEALLCGRPAISTHNFGVHRFLKDDENGVFFDGSVDDLKEKILYVKENYDRLASGTLLTPRPPLEEAIEKYRAMFCKLLEVDSLSDVLQPDVA